MLFYPKPIYFEFFAYSMIFFYGLIYLFQKIKHNNQDYQVRACILLVISLFFLKFILNLSWFHLSLMLIMTMAVYFTSRLAVHYKLYALLVGSVAALIAILLMNKILSIWENAFLVKILVILGFSYFIFKSIHFLVDSFHGMIKESSFISFCCFMIYFPVFIAGPIVRYQDFHDELSKKRDLNDCCLQLVEGSKRIILGLFKLIVCSSFASSFSLFNLDLELVVQAPAYKIILFSFMAYVDLYFKFGGYSDLAVGTSKLFGITVPENFNFPFLARNFQDFWMRWHISLSIWLRNYLFLPLLKNLSSYFEGRHILNASLALFVTFFAMGLWNGFQLNYFFQGLFLGFGALATVLWGDWIRRIGIRKKYMKSKLARVFAIISCNAYFTFCLMFFYADTPEKWDALKKVFLG